MGFLGLVPSERSTGATVRRGGITNAGNGRVRHMLVESAWTYRHPPRVGAKKLYRLEQVPPAVRTDAPYGNEWAGQKDNGGVRGHRTRARRLHVGRSKGGANSLAVPRKPSLAHRRGWNHGRGNARQTLCGRPRADARCKIGTAPDAHSEMRYPTRASELDHRRPSGSAPTYARLSSNAALDAIALLRPNT